MRGNEEKTLNFQLDVGNVSLKRGWKNDELVATKPARPLGRCSEELSARGALPSSQRFAPLVP
jgi:hypothetical protein